MRGGDHILVLRRKNRVLLRTMPSHTGQAPPSRHRFKKGGTPLEHRSSMDLPERYRRTPPTPRQASSSYTTSVASHSASPSGSPASEISLRVDRPQPASHDRSTLVGKTHQRAASRREPLRAVTKRLSPGTWRRRRSSSLVVDRYGDRTRRPAHERWSRHLRLRDHRRPSRPLQSPWHPSAQRRWAPLQRRAPRARLFSSTATSSRNRKSSNTE